MLRWRMEREGWYFFSLFYPPSAHLKLHLDGGRECFKSAGRMEVTRMSVTMVWKKEKWMKIIGLARRI